MLQQLIIFCSLCGFALAVFIHFKKRRPKPLICPIGHSCDPVVRSDYSRILGIHIEILGALYYLITLISYLALVMYPDLRTGWLSLGLLSFSAFAFLFSLYLTGVQAFILKEW